MRVGRASNAPLQQISPADRGARPRGRPEAVRMLLPRFSPVCCRFAVDFGVTTSRRLCRGLKKGGSAWRPPCRSLRCPQMVTGTAGAPKAMTVPQNAVVQRRERRRHSIFVGHEQPHRGSGNSGVASIPFPGASRTSLSKCRLQAGSFTKGTKTIFLVQATDQSEAEGK